MNYVAESISLLNRKIILMPGMGGNLPTRCGQNRYTLDPPLSLSTIMIQTTSAYRQRGNAAMYVLLSVLVVAGAAGAIYLLSQNQDDSMPVEAMPSQEQAALSAEPPAIKEVNMQEAEIDDTPARQGRPAKTQANAEDDSDEAGLFERGGRKIPLTDGLTGGSESLIGADSTAPTGPSRKVHAVDAFDYGVLDGRVRVGVFGKGPIPDYRVRLSNDHYVIDMPGEFRYVENFNQALVIERFGVGQARLVRYERGMRMRIDVTPALKHEPYLIEDSRGLMIAFEPRKQG